MAIYFCVDSWKHVEGAIPCLRSGVWVKGYAQEVASEHRRAEELIHDKERLVKATAVLWSSCEDTPCQGKKPSKDGKVYERTSEGDL